MLRMSRMCDIRVVKVGSDERSPAFRFCSLIAIGPMLRKSSVMFDVSTSAASKPYCSDSGIERLSNCCSSSTTKLS